MSVVDVEEARSVKAQRTDGPLYASRVRVYPKRVAGRFRRLKWAALVVLLAIYYVLPWIRWERGPDAPDQAVLADMVGARFYFFWIEIWPQQFYYLTGLLLLAALGIFLVSSVVGRVWCGYACPQTVWTDLFMGIERWIEGDRNARIKRDKGPFTLEKAWRKTAKHGAWLVIAAATGGVWIVYFVDARVVVPQMASGEATTTVYFFFALFTATTYALAGWAREQVCTYMCPWPRFQSAMLDEDSFVVSYKAWRGEPRGKHSKDQDWVGRGDCVACNQCVAVCPTGIDIRDGLQLQCIGCGLCVDACNTVMAKVGRPPDLIAYETERNLKRAASGARAGEATRLVRSRTILYVLLMVVVAGAMLWSLAFRPSLDINVIHERNPLFVALSDGSIRNGYTVKILNMTRVPRVFTLAVQGAEGAEIRVVGQEAATGRMAVLSAAPDGVAQYRVYLTLPRAAGAGDSKPIAFVLTDAASGEAAVRETVFRGPAR